MLRHLLPALLLASAGTALPAAAQVSKILDFDVEGALPSDDPEIAFRNQFAPGNEVAFSQSGGLLVGNSLPSVNNYITYAYPNATITGGGLSASEPFWIEARVRLVESNNNGNPNKRFGGLTVWNGNRRFTIYHVADAIRFDHGGSPGFSEVAADVTQFHVFRIEGLGSHYDAFVDGVMVGENLTAPVASGNGFEFQLSGSDAGAHVEWDYVHFHSGAPVSVEPTSWGSVKAAYRPETEE